MDGLIDILLLDLGHLSICFWEISTQLSGGRYLWIREVGGSFIHDGWLTAVTVGCSEVSLQLLHCSGELVICSWSKFKSVAFQVSTPALEVSLGFGLQA